jgi:hypothetical protein
MNETNVAVTENEEVNAVKAPVIDEIVLTAFNRKQRRMFTSLGIPFKTHKIEQRSVKNKTEFKQSKRELALTHGSKTGKLKKKHINRMKQEEANG